MSFVYFQEVWTAGKRQRVHRHVSAETSAFCSASVTGDANLNYK